MDSILLTQREVYSHYGKFYQSFKRIVEVLLCVITLPVTAPLMGLCAVLVRLDSPGPALFIQERIGKYGRPFKIYKFRTMQHNLDDSHHRVFMKAFIQSDPISPTSTTHAVASNDLDKSATRDEEAPQPIFKPFHASEITRIGWFLRKTSLDELPQILNVLAGNMSIIGPRPNVPWEVEAYQSWHYERLDVLPGITGLAQVKGRSSISFDDIVKYDVEYIHNESLWMDLKVLWWTVSTVLWGKGAK